MITAAVSPRISYRVGTPPRLPRRERTARLLNRLGVYALAWAAAGVGCWWLALGDPAGFGFIGLGGLATLLLPLSRPRIRAAGRISSRSVS